MCQEDRERKRCKMEEMMGVSTKSLGIGEGNSEWPLFYIPFLRSSIAADFRMIAAWSQSGFSVPL